MKVVFLCGGVGKRMLPLSEDKFLLKFLGETLLQYQVEQARKAGLNEFIFIGNPNNIDKIKAIMQNVTQAEFVFVVQEKPLGMANALEAAQSVLSDEPVIVVNPNDVFESSVYTSIIKEYHRGSATSYLLAYEVKEYFPGGYLVVDEAGNVKAIVEKPGKGNQPSNLVNIVVHLHTRPKEFLEYGAAAAATADDVYEQAISRMINEGYKVKPIRYNGFWKAIKYPWDIFPVMEYFLKHMKGNVSPRASISPTAVIEGEVVIEEGVTVLENVVIRGPCYIGRDSIIGNSVLLRDSSHIGEGGVVGYGTEIKHCYIGDRCWFHRNYFGDSIVGNDCSFGAGTVTANLRLDEHNIRVKIGDKSIDTGLNYLGAFIGNGVRTGINVSLMPGIRIGAGCFVGPHLCLNQDLAAGKKALTTGDYKVVDNPSFPSSLRGLSRVKRGNSPKQSRVGGEIATPSARNDMEGEGIEG